ncbi:MAG: IS66 family transposase, partial [Gammaproteobacteria bacterium]|nr:IS66 family transposase [Gammaproteobacteria bacterium]
MKHYLMQKCKFFKIIQPLKIHRQVRMTRQKAIEIYEKIQSGDREEAIQILMGLKESEKDADSSEEEELPLTPSGSQAVYKKPNHRKRAKTPGRKKGHKGEARRQPAHIDDHQEHRLCQCPNCTTPVGKSIRQREPYIEDIPEVVPSITEHTIHGYWCPNCQKIVEPVFSEAMPNDNISIRLYLFTAWLHYMVGISIHNLLKMLNYLHSFPISSGGLVQGWQRLAKLLKPEYVKIGQKARNSAVLNADETGWRLNGITHWLWCFSNRQLCYYTIERSRGSPVLLEFLGTFFKGVLICDFWGAYNKIRALAKQRCLFHLFSELMKVDKSNRCNEWKAFRKKLSRILKDAIRLHERKGELSPQQYEYRKERIHHRLKALISTAYEDKDPRRLCKRLKRHQEELFTFLEHDNVSPYNNHAEQQMRKPVITRRVSQQNRSDKGALTQAILMSIF